MNAETLLSIRRSVAEKLKQFGFAGGIVIIFNKQQHYLLGEELSLAF